MNPLVIFNSDSSTEEDVEPEMELYKGDALTPVYERRNEAYSIDEIAKILIRDQATERLCIAPPDNVSHNVSFLVDNAKMKKIDDIKCDDMGAWIHTGTPKRSMTATYKNGEIKSILHSTDMECANNGKAFVVKRTYYVNKSSSDVRKILSSLEGRLTLHVCK
jgi:lipoprotein-anchoring transpeptidase ErfK/SrfK